MTEAERDTRVLGRGPVAVESPDELSPTRMQVGRYTLVHRLGHGGMATVYLGRVTGSAGFEKRVAVKLIHPHLATEPELVRMFLDEARLAAGIHHPNVVETLDLGVDQGLHYLVMEFVEGTTLSSLVKATRPKLFPLDAVLQVVTDAATGLAAAHELVGDDGRPRKLVHRDVSPQNLLVTSDGWVKVGDFGVAKAAGKTSNTRPGELRGKLAYMSPEQARGETVDHRTDVFALGIVLWELLVGRRLFHAPSDAATLDQVVACRVPDLLDLDPEVLKDVDPELREGVATLCARALAKDPRDRFATMRAMEQELRRLRRLTSDESEPRTWLAQQVKEAFGSRLDYMRAALRDSAGSSMRAPRPVTDELDSSAERATAAIRRSGTPSPAPVTGSHPPLLSEPGSLATGLTVPVTPAQRMRQIGMLLILPMIGAGIAIAVTSRRDPAPEPTRTAAPPPMEAEATDESVRWFFSTEPPGAQVLVAGEIHTKLTPTTVSVPRGDKPVEVVLELEGFKSTRVEIAPVADQSFPYRLVPVEATALPTPEPSGDTGGEASGDEAATRARTLLRPAKTKPSKAHPAGHGANKGASDDAPEFKPMPSFGGATTSK